MEASGTGGTRFYEDGCAVAEGLSRRQTTRSTFGIRSHQNASRSVQRMSTGVSETPDNGVVTRGRQASRPAVFDQSVLL